MKRFIFKNLKNILLVLCFLMIGVNCFIAIIINNILYTGDINSNSSANTNFIVSLNEDYNKSDDIVKTKMLLSITDKSELEDITKKLIMEYITERYTVTGHKDLSIQKFIHVNDSTKIKQSILISPRISKVVLMGNGAYQIMPATSSFIKQDKEEYLNLMKTNTTRSIEIIDLPKKNNKKDEWITRVKFIYKTPDIDYLKDAKKEVYDINMVVKMGDHNGNYINNAEFIKMYYPANIFNFTVIYLDRILVK